MRCLLSGQRRCVPPAHAAAHSSLPSHDIPCPSSCQCVIPPFLCLSPTERALPVRATQFSAMQQQQLAQMPRLLAGSVGLEGTAWFADASQTTGQVQCSRKVAMQCGGCCQTTTQRGQATCDCRCDKMKVSDRWATAASTALHCWPPQNAQAAARLLLPSSNLGRVACGGARGRRLRRVACGGGARWRLVGGAGRGVGTARGRRIAAGGVSRRRLGVVGLLAVDRGGVCAWERRGCRGWGGSGSGGSVQGGGGAAVPCSKKAAASPAGSGRAAPHAPAG